MTPEELMDKGKSIMEAKAHDYTDGTDRYQNFVRQAELMSWFKSDRDKAFVGVIAIKLARLASLLDSKLPKNESIEDTFIDLINYCALWGGSRCGEFLQAQDLAPILPSNALEPEFKEAIQHKLDDDIPF